jgi:hypothetical protein
VEPHGVVCSDLYGFAASAGLLSMKTWRASEGDAQADDSTNIDSTVVEEKEVL